MNKEIVRGEEAKRLLSDPLLKEAFEAVESTVIEKLRRVDVGNRDAHRDWIVTLQLLGKVKSYLEEAAMTGKLASIAEEEKKSLLERFKGRVRA